MKRYVILVAMLILLSGCTKPTTTPEVPTEAVPPKEIELEKELTIEEKTTILAEYYNLLNQDKDLEEIITYVDENIGKLDKAIADDMILSLEEYMSNISPSMEQISETLMKYYDFTSEEVSSFLNIINREGQMMYTDGEILRVDLNELMERVLMAEEHLNKYPEGKTTGRIKDFYVGYVTGIIMGTGNQYIYAEDGSSLIKPDVLDTYKQFIESNKDLNTSQILEQYLEKLTMDNYDMNGENVLKFYDDLPSILSY